MVHSSQFYTLLLAMVSNWYRPVYVKKKKKGKEVGGIVRGDSWTSLHSSKGFLNYIEHKI